MSKPVKNMIAREYVDRFGDLPGAVVIDIRGIKANDNNRMRDGLNEKQIRVTVVKNSLARKALADTDIAPLGDLLDGPSAMVYPVNGDVSVVNIARELITWAKELKLQFRGAVMEGVVFGPDEIERLSKFPTREEAQAQVVQILLSPAQNLVGAALGPGRKVAALVNAVQEKLEAGETITKAA